MKTFRSISISVPVALSDDLTPDLRTYFIKMIGFWKDEE